MKYNKMQLLTVALLMLSAQGAGAMPVQPQRCMTTGDSLESSDAIERREWALKCFPNEKAAILFNRQQRVATGDLVEGYPTLLFVHEDGSSSNPESWFAPKDRHAPCNYPRGYAILGYCAVAATR